MVIDIINYTDAQLSKLTDEQILEVKSAQIKKNKLEADLQSKLKAEKQRLVEQRTFLSGIWELYCQEMTAKKDAEVALLKDGLTFYLRYTAKPGGTANYLVDYSLTYEERRRIVTEYYMNTYENPTERFEIFEGDTIAPLYLGEWYAPLYDYFLALSKV